jgi:hypothetical protein
MGKFIAPSWRAHDRFLLPLLLGEKAGMRAGNFLRQRRHNKSVRRNLACTPSWLKVGPHSVGQQLVARGVQMEVVGAKQIGARLAVGA